MKIKSIGIVKSPIIEGIDRGWGEVVSEIHLENSLSPGLQGLEELEWIIVIFYMHKTPPFNKTINLVRHPQGRKDLPKLGIFAQRAKHRPNSIGITVVKLISIKANIITVKGLDAVDSTPVLDIKPYTKVFDHKEGVEDPYWLNTIMCGYF